MSIFTDIMFNVSNRRKHFLYAILSAFLLTIIFVLGLAIGMEFKDYQYSSTFDWKDILATMIGGLVGQILQIILLIIIL